MIRILGRAGSIVLWFVAIISYGTSPKPWHVVRIDHTIQCLSLTGGLYLAQDSSGNLTLQELIQHPDRYDFKEVNSPVPMIENQSYWLGLDIENSESYSLTRLIELRFPFLKNSQAYSVQYNKTYLFDYKQLSKSEFSDLNCTTFNTVFPPKWRGKIYIHIKRDAGEGGIPVRLWSNWAFNRHLSTELLMWGGVAGWLICAISLSLFLFSIHRENIYLFYCLYALSHFLALIAYEGWIQYYFRDTLDGKLLIRLATFSVFFTNLPFLIKFFELKTYVSKIYIHGHYIALVTWILTIIAGFIILKFNPILFLEVEKYIDIIYQMCLMINTFYFLSYIFIAWKNKPTRLVSQIYIIAFAPLSFVMVGLSIVRLSLVKALFFVEIHFYSYAVVFETVILLFALAYRFKLYRDERETALREQRNVALQTLFSERARLARELHDYIGPDLAGLKMQMESDHERSINPSKHQLGRYLSSVARILTDVRQVSHALLPTDLQENNLIMGLTKFIDTLSAVSGNPEISFVYDLKDELPPFIQQSVFQIIKELILNAIKHAKATLIDVELYSRDRMLYLTVADDGQGYNPTKVLTSEGIGLRNLQAVVILLNGHLEVRQKHKRGMVHHISLLIK